MTSHDPRASARALADAARTNGEPLRWFETLYAEAHAGRANVPWADMAPNPHLVSWRLLERLAPRRALVVGCGYGDDAEWLAARGWDVTAFDISPTAVERCRRRFPDSAVHYVAANLISPPPWWRPFDLVVEIYTVQVLPPGSAERAAAIASLRALTARDLLVVARGREAADPEGRMPWPLTEAEVHSIAGGGLEERGFEDIRDDETPPVRRFRAHFHRPADATPGDATPDDAPPADEPREREGSRR